MSISMCRKRRRNHRAIFPPPAPPPPHEGPLRIFPYAISRDLVERVIRGLGLDARTVGLLNRPTSSWRSAPAPTTCAWCGSLTKPMPGSTSSSAIPPMRYGACCSISSTFWKGSIRMKRRRRRGKRKRASNGLSGKESKSRSPRVDRHFASCSTASFPGRDLMAQSTGREPQRYLVIYPPEPEDERGKV